MPTSWLFILTLALSTFYLSACGASEDQHSPESGKISPAIPTQFRNCDLRHPFRASAKNFGTDIGTPALLSVVAWAEGLGNCYHYTYAYHTFESFADHPQQKICAGAYCSSAAGRYQFLYATWQQLALKNRYPSFEPLYQDEGALALMREKQVDDAVDIYDFPRFKRAMGLLSPVWASLPGSPYGQPTRTMEAAWQRYEIFSRDPAGS